MKKIFLVGIFASVCFLSFADNVLSDISVTDLKTERNGNYLTVGMSILLSDLDVPSNRAVLLTPMLVNGDNKLQLPSVAVYGRRRYYYYRRNVGSAMLSGENETSYRAKSKPEAVAYREILPYEHWMDGAQVMIYRSDYGCCRRIKAEDFAEVGRYSEAFFPELIYVRPSAIREKRRTLEGSAFIDFPVDQTAIYPDYRRNATELESIRATIDAVRNNPDAKIDSVWLKGYASPEGPYSHNAELAVGRTGALKEYISRIYHFADVAMIAEYEAEDWVGLRKAVENSSLEHRSEILSEIDREMDPDAKEWRIKSMYPEDYRYMVQNYYPALRHTDYRVSYVIRSYSDPAEILTMVWERPQNLDLNEFYVAASELEPGTDVFTEVFETAVRMFPNDESANLNAANAALRRGDNAGAERYIRKAGDSPEAIYARGAIAIRNGEYDTARRYLREAKDAGLEQAAVILEELEDRLR